MFRVFYYRHSDCTRADVCANGWGHLGEERHGCTLAGKLVVHFSGDGWIVGIEHSQSLESSKRFYVRNEFSQRPIPGAVLCYRRESAIDELEKRFDLQHPG
ncbi:MAG: hypothetical protein AABZ58_06665, partial [Chloroflexota bacterium]